MMLDEQPVLLVDGVLGRAEQIRALRAIPDCARSSGQKAAPSEIAERAATQCIVPMRAPYRLAQGALAAKALEAGWLLPLAIAF